ncbi:MAG: hypothetical protein JKY83_03150 [Rhizobiaceae bacterium]|nr:hypothetical protein [Rhizobiaceae bacterium]
MVSLVNAGGNSVCYTAIENEERLAERNFRRLAASSAATKNLRKSPFFRMASQSGQMLAGSGALVFEGELLEFPRTFN